MIDRSTGLTYRDSGVDIESGDRLVENIKPFAKKTMRPEVLAGIGGFGALFELAGKYRQPVLVSGTDGVGTKLKLAFLLDWHSTIGIDLVAMSVNDILVQGAEPLFFLDYFACGQLSVDTATTVIQGIAEGCHQAKCALIGGETAEMPGMYPPGEYDLAGFAVGAVEKDQIVDSKLLCAGDVVLGLASSGLHSNGYSLVRKIITQQNVPLQTTQAHFGEKTMAEVLMEPTRIYVSSILTLLTKIQVKAMAHITGGGLLENIPRILPAHLQVTLDSVTWPRPPIFQWLQKAGQITDHEMYRTFNCGIGYVVVIAADQAGEATKILAASGEHVYEIGRVETRTLPDRPILIS